MARSAEAEILKKYAIPVSGAAAGAVPVEAVPAQGRCSAVKPRCFTVALRAMLVASLALPATAAPPTPLESYGRMITLLYYMTAHVGELLLACAERKVLTEQQAEERYQAYRRRNAALLERAENWRQEAEKRLQAQAEERAARNLAEQAGFSATAAASARAQGEIGKAADAHGACATRLAAIESGRYDLSGNAEFVELLNAQP